VLFFGHTLPLFLTFRRQGIGLFSAPARMAKHTPKLHGNWERAK
jgi:hypothetical protein